LINKLLESKKQTQRNRSTVKLSTNAVSIYIYTHTYTHIYKYSWTPCHWISESWRAEPFNQPKIFQMHDKCIRFQQ